MTNLYQHEKNFGESLITRTIAKHLLTRIYYVSCYIVSFLQRLTARDALFLYPTFTVYRQSIAFITFDNVKIDPLLSVTCYLSSVMHSSEKTVHKIFKKLSKVGKH